MFKNRFYKIFLTWIYFSIAIIILIFTTWILFKSFYNPPVVFELDDTILAPTYSDTYFLETSEDVSTDFKIFINQSTLDDLILLPGIGKILANAIIENRSTFGPFHYPEDILSVKGIGKSKLSKIIPYLILDY